MCDMKSYTVYVIFSLLFLRGGAQLRKTCFLNGAPVSCNNPTYLTVSAGQQQGGRTCFLNGNVVPCGYTNNVQFPQGSQQFGGRTCFLNGSPVPCSDPLYLSATAGQQQVNGRQCFFNGFQVVCSNPPNPPAYLGGQQNQHVPWNQLGTNQFGNHLGTNQFGNQLGSNQFGNHLGTNQFGGKRCYLNGNLVSCTDPLYLSTLGSNRAGSGQQCFLSGYPVSCDDPLYLNTVQAQKPSQNNPQQCYLNGSPVSCNDPRYVSASRNKPKPDGNVSCYLDSNPISCDDPLYLQAIEAQNYRPQTQPPPAVYPQYPSPTDRPIQYPQPPSTQPPIYYPLPPSTQPPIEYPLPPSTQPPIQYPPTTQRPVQYPQLPSWTQWTTQYPTTPPSTTERPFQYPPPPPSSHYSPPKQVPKCGQQVQSSIVPLIENGVPVTLGTFPWIVAIYDKTQVSTNRLICSGSIITPYAILSAAHCFFDQNGIKSATNYEIGVGKISREYSKTDAIFTRFYEIERIIVEGYYSRQSYYNDITVVQMKNEIQFSYNVHTVCINFKDVSLRTGLLLHVSGWGVDESKEASSILKTAQFPYLSFYECGLRVPEETRLFIGSDKFCIDHVNGTALGAGDSGGGLTFLNAYDRSHYIVGIVSFVPYSEKPAVAVITNVLSYREFILRSVREIHMTKNFDVNYLESST